MATLQTLTLDVYDMLFGEAQVQRPVEDTIISAIASDSDTSWRFATDKLWKRGDYAELWTGDGEANEVVVMAEDHPSGGDITVRRGQRRSTAESSISTGAVFLKNPPVTATMIQRAINETIDNDLYGNPFRVFYRSHRTITPVTNKYRYDLNAEDYKVEDVYQIDLSPQTIGAATYDEAGGGVDDEWTSAAHGLAAGDHVRFSAVGTGASGYAVDTDYWVAAVPDANTFTLSATNGGSEIEGTGDSGGTWTLVKQLWEQRELNPHWWKEQIDKNTAYAATNSALVLSTWHSDDYPIYYTARTRPSSAAISSLTDDIVDLVPWGAMARLIGSVSVRDRIDPRRRSERDAPQQPFADSEFFRQRFLEMKRSLHNRLIGEKQPRTRFHLPHLAGRY